MNEMLADFRFDFGPHLMAIVSAYLLALPIGWNREQAERTAGLRTFPLVAVAGCGFVLTAQSMTGATPEALARIIEGVIVGMGFIGGGAILRLKHSVKGTATAASLWVTGAIGISVGLGSLDVAIILSVVTFLTLSVLSPLKPDDRAADEADRDAPAER